MSRTQLAALLAERLDVAGLELSPDVLEPLAAYLDVLARWNRKINLTAFDLDAPSAHAIDRLVIEPVRAAQLIRRTDRVAIDIGSGGGSPAIPLAVCCRHLRFTLVEVRARKAAFLREAVRTVALEADVAARRFEDVAGDWPEDRPVDVVTVRAVRPDEAVWNGIDRVLASRGFIVWFGIGQTTDSRFTSRSEPQGVVLDGCMFERVGAQV